MEKNDETGAVIEESEGQCQAQCKGANFFVTNQSWVNLCMKGWFFVSLFSLFSLAVSGNTGLPIIFGLLAAYAYGYVTIVVNQALCIGKKAKRSPGVLDGLQEPPRRGRGGPRGGLGGYVQPVPEHESVRRVPRGENVQMRDSERTKPSAVSTRRRPPVPCQDPFVRRDPAHRAGVSLKDVFCWCLVVRSVFGRTEWGPRREHNQPKNC